MPFCRCAASGFCDTLLDGQVLVVEDEAGNIVREQTKDTEVIAQYKTMREALVYLTHLDQDDTESVMLEKLAQQVRLSVWGRSLVIHGQGIEKTLTCSFIPG